MKRQRAEAPALPGFSVIKALGSGGFSDVYLYQQERPRRQVAVKVLLADDLTESARQAFDAEADTMAALSAHSSIVSIYQADISVDGRPYFVMEYYGGPTLADRYKRETLSVVEVLRIGIRLAGAIATAHSHGILHRDIKPGNVLTNDYGALGLTDFGISSRVEVAPAGGSGGTWALGGSGSTSGTESQGMSIPWSPPESFDDEPAPDVRSDLFSLAATIYTLLAGRTPFERVDEPNYENDLVGRILRGAVTPLSRTDVPSSLIAVLRKAMSVERADRFGDVVQFARALQRVEIELGYSETPLEVPNLNVPSGPAPAGDDADRTRARGITSIPAQEPAAPARGDATRIRAVPVVDPSPAGVVVPDGFAPSAAPPTPRPTAGPAAPPADATVRRPAPAPASPAPAPASPAAAPETADRPRGRGRLLAVVGALAAVAVVATVVALVVVDGQPADDGPESAVSNTAEDPILGGVVPAPELDSKTSTADGTAATFVWRNPDPQPGDTFVWMRTDPTAADRSPTETTETSVTIDELTPGVPVCISVEIVRAGRGSVDPLEECVP